MKPSAYHYAPPFLEVKYCWHFTPNEIFRINNAFMIAWIVHAHSPNRMNGHPYITHPVEMVQIAIDEFCIYDSHLIIDLILHDTDEHSIIPFFNHGIKIQFGVSVAEDNNLLTKTDENKAIYLEDIVASGKWRPLLAKLIDRLHNMRTLENSSVAFQQKQAKETRDLFLPLCNELSKIIPKEYETVPPIIYIELSRLCEKYGC